MENLRKRKTDADLWSTDFEERSVDHGGKDSVLSPAGKIMNFRNESTILPLGRTVQRLKQFTVVCPL